MLDKIYYINLDVRTDRREHIENNVKEPLLEWFDETLWTRLAAVDRTKEASTPRRAAGCSLSHLKIWKDAIDNGYKHVMIFEDDFEFIIEPSKFYYLTNELFRDFPNFTICNFAYNNLKPLYPIENNSNFFKSWDIQTTGGYIADVNFLKNKLMQPTINSVRKLNENQPTAFWAIDVVWKKFQNDPNWLLMKRAGKQLAGVSDIEKMNVDYGV
jgi:GR25 family glycosyltransferase involved in LPS biosynthesis